MFSLNSNFNLNFKPTNFPSAGPTLCPPHAGAHAEGALAARKGRGAKGRATGQTPARVGARTGNNHETDGCCTVGCLRAALQ